MLRAVLGIAVLIALLAPRARLHERRLTTMRYEGRWENVGTPADLARLDATLAPAGPERR